MASKKPRATAGAAGKPTTPAAPDGASAPNGPGEAATQASGASDVGGEPISGQVGAIVGKIGNGEQIDGQGLPPVAAEKTHLRVAARRDGFRRCGRAWPAAGVTVAKADFTDAQISTLLADPDLVATEVSE